MVHYILTNLGKQKPWREGLLDAPPVKVNFDGLAMADLVSNCTLQDARLPDCTSDDLVEQYAEELPNIILGNSKYWKLWRAVITEEALELHNIDLNPENDKRQSNYRKCSVLVCRIAWANGMRVHLSAHTGSGDWDGMAPAFAVTFQSGDVPETKKHKDILIINFRIQKKTYKVAYTITT